MHLDTPEIRAIVARAFPDYTGRKFVVEPFQGPMRLTSYWSGGSRDYWTAVRLTDGSTGVVPENGTPFMPEVGELRDLPENTVLVLHHAGPNSYVCLYVRPDNMNRLSLPAPVELTLHQKVVLAATASLKSSYAGVRNYRFHEATKETGIGLMEWDKAKAECIALGFLNGAGAITNAGRNAVAGTRLHSLKAMEVLCQ